MEGEARDQKLRAGKEKLAQFQRKKRKKKPRPEEAGSSAVTVEESANILPPLPVEFETDLTIDSDSLTTTSGSEDDTDSAQEWSSRAQLQLKSKLQEKSRRVEELEESLVGKQLALDKVIQENEKLKTLTSHVQNTEVSDANHNALGSNQESQNQSRPVNGLTNNQSAEAGTSANTEVNEAGSQEFSMSDVQELLHHVQWLQLQLKQANTTLQIQNEKQKESIGALQNAKKEIAILQDSITHKDKLLNELIDKMKQISTEYESFKQHYAKSGENKNEKLVEELEKHCHTVEEMNTALKKELQKVVTEKEKEIQELIDNQGVKIGQLTEEYEMKIKELESNLQELRIKHEGQELNYEKIQNENVGLQSYCDTLTKGLEFLKEEHEKAVTELNELSAGFKVLKSEYDILVDKKGQFVAKSESLEAALNDSQIEKEHISTEMSVLKKQYKYLEKELNDTKEQLEIVRVEHQRYFNDNNTLVDQLAKQKEDNMMYQNQIAEYEGKLCESAEILEENRSLHWQNDELNNRINNQKDVIASLKNELEVLGMEKSQFADHMKNISADLEEIKKENDILKADKEQLLNEVRVLKENMHQVEEENLKYKVSHVALNEEIQSLKQSLSETHSEIQGKVPLLTSGRNTKFELTATDMNDMNREKLDEMNPSEEVEDVITPQENVYYTEEMPHVHKHQTHEVSLNSDLGETVEIVKDSVELCENLNETVMDKTEMTDSAKTKNVSQTVFQDKNRKIEELEGEIEKLNNVIVQLQSSALSAGVSASVHKVVQNDDADEEEVDSISNKVSTQTSTNDTAYESLYFEHQEELGGTGVNVLAERLAETQQKLDTVSQMLSDRNKEYEEVKLALMQAQEQLAQDSVAVETTSEDSTSESALQLNHYTQPKVSENSSVTSLGMEVNMHASSLFCFVPNDGVVSLDSSQVKNVKDSSEFYVDKGSFQNLAEDPVDEKEFSDTKLNAMQVPHQELHIADCKCIDSSLTEQTGSTENSEVLKYATFELKNTSREILIESMNLQASAGTETMLDEKSLNCELELTKESLRKMEIERRKLESINSDLQMKLKEFNDTEHERKEKAEELCHEHEKLTWERDQLIESLHNIEKEMFVIKTAKCDVEFQKVQYEEELNRVKERLEYLESSDNDIIEIKDMLEKVQEERENIFGENEKLQCSLSAHIEENEKLLESIEYLQKENSSYLERLEVKELEIISVTTEYKDCKSKIEKLEKNLNEIISEKLSQESRFEGEIEGLLEENSTLKTCVHMKESEIETLIHENDRLNSFFPNTDEQIENSKLLKARNGDLEKEMKDLALENQSLVSELLDSQEKLSGAAVENEELLDKCDEFQRVICELDEEKTTLVESYERAKQETKAQLKENENLIEKYENQLECLDQENSTLKTHLMSLHQEIEDNNNSNYCQVNIEKDNLKIEKEMLQIENERYKAKVQELEEDLLGLVEQVKLYDESVKEKEDISVRLEARINEILQENTQLKEKCASVEESLHEQKESEIYLKEQMKIYESALNSEEKTKGLEVQRLEGQLELEKKYKNKFENSLAQAQSQISGLESENTSLKDMNVMLQRDLELEIQKTSELEQEFSTTKSELDNAVIERERIVKEKMDFSEKFNASTKVNEELISEVSVLQNHLQAVADNRNHIRNQIEILAAEIENLQRANESLGLHNREIGVKFKMVVSSNDKLAEENKLFTAKIMEISDKSQKLADENELLRQRNKKLEDNIQENLDSVKEEMNNLHYENEKLTEENVRLKENMIADENNFSKTAELQAENDRLKSENKELEDQNEKLRTRFKSLGEKLASLDELIERNIAAELDNDSLGDRLDVLHKRIGEIQKEKESLQIMTNELTNMLHDMQTKYEEVKSEMEATKKKCDKEIEHLQNQLHEMNDDVSELRKMLDYMENEMYSTTEEKNMLKENLEQQQSQFAEVIEEKQKLEEIISNKQQKDLKNMQMASQRQKNTTVPYSRNEQDVPCNEPETVEASCSNSEFSEVAAPAVSERMRESIDTDLSDIVPSFQSAFHLFGLASSGETCVTSRMVQTNVSMSGSGNTSFMIDNNGENTDYNTDSSKIHSEAQTDISCQPYSHFNFQNSVFEPLFNENDDNEITNVEDFADNTPGFGNGELTAQGVVDSHQTGRISEVTQYVEDNYCKSLGKCNISSQTEIQVKSVYCQNDKTLCQNLENSELLTQDISSQTDLEENIIDSNSGNVSILSADSGILSACVDGKIQPFHYTENETVIDREIHNEQDTFEAENFVEISSENSENISKEAEFFDIGIQTDKDFGDEIEKSLADDRERLEADHEEKIKEFEAEIESRLVKVYEFREQKIKLLEDNYERKVKQVEYDLEEKYEQKFRMREVDIIMEADRDKKIHAAEVENAAEIKVEQIKREKDQQFVETLQKVKADLAEKHRRTSGDMRRAVSHDVRPRDRDQDIGADGDGKGTYGANTWQKLVAENQKHVEGDDLQKSVDTNQQNTIAFCQQLLGIMGEHTTMGNNKPPKNQQAPTLLDWDLSPELSFGSVQSSLGTNTLERSLDTSAFCSNSECVNLRMKYEQLMGKIEQYLKFTTSQDHVKESDTKSVPDVVDGKSELDKDMFVEHDEDLSHMLYRGTSIDLEHCFRVPSSLNENSLDDHFVEEVDDTKDTVEITSDIIDLLVKGSNDAAVKKYNWEGHFSEDEEVDEENEGDEQKQIILDHGRGSISFVEDTRSFLKEESLLSRKKRYFSESDLRTNVKESESETFQSENNEGFFVLEGGVSKEEADQRSKSKNYDISDDEASDEDGNSDGIFEEIQNSLDAPVFMENSGSPRLHLDLNKFIEESNEYKPPGLEEFAMCSKTEPLTGEEAGDFFEEKIVKSVVLSSGSVKNMDTVALSTPPRQDLADVAQNLESDLSSVKQEYKKGNQSYENTVFDILNAICPGTVPGRRPCDVVAKEDTFQPVIGEVESAVNDFGESQTENNLQKLKAELGNMKLELQSLTKENTDLKEMMIIKDLDSKKNIEVLKEKITALEKTNLEKNAEVLHAEQLLSSNRLVEEKCRNLENANMEVLNDLEIYKNQMSDLEGKAKENADKLEMLKMILESERNEQKNLKLQYTETEKFKNELELQCCSFSVQNEKLESDLKVLENSFKNNEKELSVLKEEKRKLIFENNSLKSVIESNEDVLQSQEKLKLKIQELSRQEDVLREELKKQIDGFKVEKDELEKALIAQADMYDSLEKKMKDQEIESNKLKECLEIQEKNKEALQENIEIVMNENKILKEDFEKEISTKMESKIKENEHLSEISALKSEINELNVMSSQMSTENEKLKVTANEAVEKTTVMKEEKEKLNSVIQEIGKEKKDMEEELRDKETTISELIKAKQDLVHQIEKFEEDAKSLQSNVAEMKETVDKLTKENNMLESFQSDMQGVHEENESLKLQLLQMKERNSENEWAIQELSKEVEKQELNTSNTNEESKVDKSTETEDIIDGFEPKENKLGLVDAFSNTDDHLGFEIHEKELTLLKEEIICLKTKNSALENNLKEISSRDTSEQELEALKLENETLKRSLDFAIVKDDSDTDLQIFEDMKDAIRSMQAEKSSVDQYEKEMSDSMEQENKRLRDEIEDLYAETDQLKKSLKKQEESARKENREILKMYSDLRNEVEVLVISKHDLEVELHALKDLLEHDPYPTPEKSEHDTSKELTLEDLEEMEELKASIEKLKSDLKERDSYVRKLEEHLLSMDGNIPELTSTPKPSLSKGMPFISKSFLRRGQNLSSHFGRRAYSQDMPSINVEKEFDERNSVKPELERSQTLDSSLHICDLESYKPTEKQFHDGLKSEKLTSSVLSDSSNSSVQGSFGVSERIRSGLKAEEDGHLALELKQFELVAEITKLRRDFRETKALYSKETALLTEALEKEKLANELRGMSDLSQEHNVGSNLSHDVLKLRKEVATLREQNKLLNIDCDRWVERLKEQEQIVADLKERISQNTSGFEEIEEVFGRQLALLQKQREELIDKLKDRERENSSLSAYLGEKGILEETLRKEKDVLSAKLKEKEKIEEELLEKKLLLEEQGSKQKELEDIVYQKDLNEIELMKQKRILEEELREIESRFRDREENLDFEKNKLLNELREKRTKAVRSRFSESEDEVSSVCSESAAFSERNIGRLEVMLEEVEKQHSLAVNVLREQLHVKYNRREKELRREHAAGLARLKQDSRNQVK